MQRPSRNISVSSFGAKNNSDMKVELLNKSNDCINPRLNVNELGLNSLTSKIVIGTLTAEFSFVAMV